jgi:hypothetical protein
MNMVFRLVKGRTRLPLFFVALVFYLANAEAAISEEPISSPYAQWQHGPPKDENYFPIAVWLQSPRNASRYKAAGINLYVGLWRGPTTNQLAELEQAGMPVICEQNRTALRHLENPIIVGWMHGDEPDNAQTIPGQKGYGPPISPDKIIADFEKMRRVDPSRPVLLNLGQGVAWDNYIGRGVRRNHPEDYALYLQGCDIASFDIYPVVHESPEIAGRLEWVGRGVERLVNWSAGHQIVWNCIECTHISNPGKKASPQQVRAEVWMSLIQGSRGLIYFVHQFEPKFNEAALLDDPEMLAAVTSVNGQISELAAVLNGPSLSNTVTIAVEEKKGTIAPGPEETASKTTSRPISWMHKRRGHVDYLFAVNMENRQFQANFSVADLGRAAGAVVLAESRGVPLTDGQFSDDFQPYAVHLYAIGEPGSPRALPASK